MRIGKWEIRRRGKEVDANKALDTSASTTSTTRDFSGVFAVPDTEAWWLAVHQIVDQAERETIDGARAAIKPKSSNPEMCISAVGAGEGVDLVRKKLLAARNQALSNVRETGGFRK